MKKIKSKWGKGVIIGIGILISPNIHAQTQDIQLANQYYEQKDYDKAKEIYQKIIKRKDESKSVYENYISTLENLKEFKEAERYIKGKIKSEPNEVIYKIDYALLLEKEGKEEEANKQLEKFVDEIASNIARVDEAAKHFINKEKIEWAEKSYLAARKKNSDKSLYAFQLAEVYRQQGNTGKMLEEYIEIAVASKNNISNLQNALQDNLTKAEDFEKLEQILINKIQSEPNESVYNDLLIWYYIQQKDFYKAFMQARSIDKRMKLQGVKLMELGQISLQNKDFKSASAIYEYLVKEYPQHPNYPVSRRYLIISKEELVKNTFPINLTDIQSLIKDYQLLINEVGKNSQTAEAFRNMGLLYGFYLDKKDSALVYLEEAIKIARANPELIAKCKLDMGDIYLLKNEPWEATLLYSQVEKEAKEQPIGHEAKLKNAKLSYYKGDFVLAQSHLDILKLATSREIANDAMDLSLLIQDNLALDTVGEAMKEYAAIEMLLFQNKNDEALQRLEQMKEKYPKHSLIDEVLWLQANIFIKQDKNEEAVQQLEKIVNNYSYDILSDDAHFMIAKLFEEKLNQKEKAKEMYQNHLTKYPGSIYAVEARKRFRELRGDKIN